MSVEVKDGTPKRAPYLMVIVGCVLMPFIWLVLKCLLNIDDRYLPSPAAVILAAGDIEPSIWVHLFHTAVRLVIGFLLGVFTGVGLGICMNKFRWLSQLLGPTLDSMRSVPAIAIVPFFLLWFGFAETGRVLLVVTGIAFNIAIATRQVLSELPEKHRILFKSFGLNASSMTWDYSIPRIIEDLLPTVRFSLSTAMGVVIASELLGSQVGLGYLIQTARSTFSMHVIFLSTILLGLLSAVMDWLLTRSWSRLLYWR